MAIPPIISNNPLLKLFRTDQSGGTDKTKTSDGPSTPQDVVEISDAARKRLDGVRHLSEDKPEEVKDVAGETRDILESNQNLTLGPNQSQAG